VAIGCLVVLFELAMAIGCLVVLFRLAIVAIGCLVVLFRLAIVAIDCLVGSFGLAMAIDFLVWNFPGKLVRVEVSKLEHWLYVYIKIEIY
jgi:hypothetical protein